jgi:hypothetical protein
MCAQPATLLYAWQVEVMLDSFIRNNVPQNSIHIICSKNDEYYAGWDKLVIKYSDVNFFFYEDTRKEKNYVSSIRPNILKQHFLKNPYLANESIFYHDCDIILTKPINWDSFTKDDFWYGSDCCDYLGYKHIVNKGGDVLIKMCKILNISPELVRLNQNNSIGAQYVLKGIDTFFWENIENDSERLYVDITKLNKNKEEENPSYEKIVIYCADMWALLWNGWKMGRKTLCSKDLSFSWAPRGKDNFDEHSIFHNAGIQHEMQNDYFYKYNYINKLPYSDNPGIKTNTASYEYWKEIKKTGETTVLY